VGTEANPVVAIEARRKVSAWLTERTQHFEDLLVGKGIQARTFIAAVASDAMREPRLAEAIRQSPETLLEQLSVCAGAGLLPGSAYGQFYLIPRWASKRNRIEVTSITGYKGLSDMAYRHARVFSVTSNVVFEGEQFEFDPGEQRIVHKWNPDVPREKLEHVHAAYARVELCTPEGQHAGGKPIIRVCSKKEILAAMAQSETGRRGYGPWIDHPIPMAMKTPLRRLLGSGQVPRQNDLIVMMAHDSQGDTIVDPGASSKAKLAGVAGLKVAVGAAESGAAEQMTPDQMRAELARLTKDLPDAADPAMMSDEDVANALLFYIKG